MGQHQINVSVSLQTKLLLGVATLLVIVIAALNISAIILLKEDKRAYTYQIQGTEAVLAGREFSNIVERAIDSVRQSLASIEFSKTITPRELNIVQSIIDNQNQIYQINFLLKKKGQEKLTGYQTFSSKKHPPNLKWSAEEEKSNLAWIEAGLSELLKTGVHFFNLSKVGAPPILALAIADLNVSNNATGTPIAVAFITLENFLKDLQGPNLSIANLSGWVLFDSDPEKLFGRKNLTSDPLFQIGAKSEVASGAHEYSLESTDYLGSYYRPGLGLIVLSRTQWKDAMKATYTLTEKFLLLAVMAVAIAILFARIFAKNLSAPIKDLYDATKEVALGNFNLRLKSKSRDEIGALSSSFNIMSEKIAELIRESIQKTRIEGELAIASAVQQTLIPPTLFQSKNIMIRSAYESASECGGDWWGFFTSKNKLAIFIADATGHGLPSALITASAHSCFTVIEKLAEDDSGFKLSPATLLKYANRAIYNAASGKIMMTFFAGVLDFEKQTLIYSSAGHNPPWIFKKSGDRYKMSSLTAKGNRLGEAQDVPEYEEKTIQISADDILFLYTDGLIEGKNNQGEPYGKKRMRKIIENNLVGGPDLIVSSLIKDFRSHNQQKVLDDDITLAAAIVRNPTRFNA